MEALPSPREVHIVRITRLLNCNPRSVKLPAERSYHKYIFWSVGGLVVSLLQERLELGNYPRMLICIFELIPG